MDIKKQLTLPALFLSCGLLLPIAFHMFGMAGKIFLPMHIPVLMSGLLLGWRQGLCMGLFTPILSSILTGMPPLYPMAPIMAIELALYGAAGGYLYKNKHLSPLLAVLGALVAGRLGVVIMLAIFASTLQISMSPWIYVAMAAANGAPGIIIQLLFLPPLVKKLEGYLNISHLHM